MHGLKRYSMVVGVVAIIATAVPPAASSQTATPQARAPGTVDRFLIVDCLLPGQIRKLGRQITFLAARRAVKTSASDCEIRGGEYVAWDRANYATALKVWLPLANEGDVLAQTYVGEIYEKGLGTPPDHAEAARWYRRAAESGSARAAINLAHLYEQGHGVARDPREALAWYKRAGASGTEAHEAAASPAAVQGPTIELVDPERLVVRGEVVRELALQPSIDRIVVTGRLVDGETVAVNGQPQRLDDGKRFRASLAVPPPSERVTISATDAGGRTTQLAFVVRTREPLVEKSASDLKLGRYHALVIGNDDYRLLPRLTTASRDAREVARVLRDEYGFAVTLLLNASRYDILSALNDLRQRLGAQDNLLLFYSGHGEADTEGRHGFWLPVDAEPNTPASWISNLTITEVLSAMDVRHVLVAADSCYAGTMSRSSVGYVDFGTAGAPAAAQVEALAKRRARLVMTSGGCQPATPVGEPPHSVFARSFIDVLRGNRGVLPGQEMFRLLRVRLSATTAQPATSAPAPVYGALKYAGHEAGDFIFVRAATRR